MSIWWLLLIIAGLGALGGVVNALMTDNGFALPKREASTNIVRPGFLGNLLLGAVAAVIFWGLYGPFAEVVVVGQDPEEQVLVRGATRDENDKYGETLAGLIGALVIGAGGARFITSEVDKKLLQAAATEAAASNANADAAVRISNATPVLALETARNM